MSSRFAHLKVSALMQSSTSNIFVSQSVASTDSPSAFSCSTFPDIDSIQMQSSLSSDSYASDNSELSFTHSPTNSDSSDMPIADLILGIAKSDESITFYKNGYEIIERLGDSVQGELFKAEVITNDKNVKIGSHVVIKKTEKELFSDQIAIQDETTFCVSENIMKEAAILELLTVKCKSNMARDYIAQFVDLFESDSHLYLVTKYIPNSMNLKAFISKYHQLMKDGKLQKKHYLKCVKFIMWQLSTIIYWLHNVYQCCHLGLSLDNILIENGVSALQPNVANKSLSNIRVVIADFGVAEIFKSNSFKCNKQILNINTCNVSPQIINGEIYDARAADLFSLGLIIYECITGKPLYTAYDIIWNQTGYNAICNNKLRKYLTMNDSIKWFKSNSFSLLKQLLFVEENQRINSTKLLKHSWFRLYYQRYVKILNTESVTDKKMFEQQMRKMNNFTFYHLY